MNQGSFQRLRVMANSPKKRRSVPFSSHLAINSLEYLITSPLSKFTAFSNSGFAFLFGKLNLWNFIDMKQGTGGWTPIQSGSISYSGGVPSWQPLSQLIPSNCATKSRTKSKTRANCCKNEYLQKPYWGHGTALKDLKSTGSREDLPTFKLKVLRLWMN